MENEEVKAKKWYGFLRNKYIWVTLFFAVWMIFLDNYSYFDHRVLNEQIQELEDNKEYYKGEIHHDQVQIKKLNNIDETEKYAREKYYMKKDSEEIFIVEFEGDTIKKK